MAKRRGRGRNRQTTRGALDLMQYAVTGAKIRLQELAREAGELFRHFPQLRTESPSPWAPGTPGRRGPGARRRGAAGTPTEAGGGTVTRRRRKRKLSAEARAKISAAQKRRWAAQKRKQGK